MTANLSPNEIPFMELMVKVGCHATSAILVLGEPHILRSIPSFPHAAAFADGLQAAGFEVLNKVESNQVLVAFGDDKTTARVIEGVQRDGTCWCGGTTWHGRKAMRISLSSWATTESDVERSLAAMLKVARESK